MSTPLNIVITGANRGIGLELTRHYQQQGALVYACCRQRSAALEALNDTGADTLNVRLIEGCDLAVADSAQKVAAQLAGVPIHYLINNAGIFYKESLQDMDFASIEQQFAVNTMGTLRLTHALLAQLSAGSKIAMLSSIMGSIANNDSGAYYGYRMSKAALNAAAKSLAQDLKPRQISVGIFHPGFVATEMVGGQGDISPADAAHQLAERIEQLSLDNSGHFYHANGNQLPW